MAVMAGHRHPQRQLDSGGFRGRHVLDPKSWRRLRQSLKLSPREIQIVQHIFDDHKEWAIAADLGISPHTVNTYTQRLYRKLGVNSRPQLIVHMFRTLAMLPAKSPPAKR